MHRGCPQSCAKRLAIRTARRVDRKPKVEAKRRPLGSNTSVTCDSQGRQKIYTFLRPFRMHTSFVSARDQPNSV